MPNPRARRNLLAAGLAVAVVVVVALVVVNLQLFVYPASSTPAHADAVVVLAGGDGERLDRGLDLVRTGVAPTLVASTGPERLCNNRYEFEVICFLPDPDDTRGEAEAIGRLADEQGWDHIVLVTSDYHATRARILVERCFDGRVDVSVAKNRKGPLSLLWAIGHEWGGLVETTIHEDC